MMATGTVIWFNPHKQFGFIGPDDGDKDVFVHQMDVTEAGLETLQEGQRLEFTRAEYEGRIKATELKLAEA